jgi:hypothetical protein
MRRKKRYAVFRSIPEDLPSDAEFLFQNERGYVFRMDPKTSERLRKTADLISGSIWKVKGPQSTTRKSRANQ